MGATNGLGLPIPELTEMADGPDAISDLANATEDYFYDRILPAGITRHPSYHWGSGTTFPTTGLMAGDTYFHTGLGGLMRYSGVAWRQTEMFEVANAAARNVISTNYSSLLYRGFRVYEADKGYIREWDPTGSLWRYMGRPGAEHPYCYVDRGSLAWGNFDGKVYGFTQRHNLDTTMFTTVPGTSGTEALGGGITVTEAGRYRVSILAAVECPSTYYGLTRIDAPGIPTTNHKMWPHISQQGSNNAPGYADFFVTEEGWLPAGQRIQQRVYLNTNGTILRGAWMIVQRIP